MNELTKFSTQELLREIASRTCDGSSAAVCDAEWLCERHGVPYATLCAGKGEYAINEVFDRVCRDMAVRGHSHSMIAFALCRRSTSTITKAIKRSRERILQSAVDRMAEP